MSEDPGRGGRCAEAGNSHRYPNSALKDNYAYKQYLAACVAPVDERITSEYSANV